MSAPDDQTFWMRANKKAAVSPNRIHPSNASSGPMSAQPGSRWRLVPPTVVMTLNEYSIASFRCAAQCTKQMVSDGPHPRFKTMQAYGAKGGSPNDKDRQRMGETFFPIIFQEDKQSSAEQSETIGVEDNRHNNEGYTP